MGDVREVLDEVKGFRLLIADASIFIQRQQVVTTVSEKNSEEVHLRMLALGGVPGNQKSIIVGEPS